MAGVVSINENSPQSFTLTAGGAVFPFSNLTISDTVSSELILATLTTDPDNTAVTLPSPVGSATISSTTGTGGQDLTFITGDSADITATLRNVELTIGAVGNFGQTASDLSVENFPGGSSIGNTVTLEDDYTYNPPAPTPAQLKVVAADVIAYYTDKIHNRSTTPDLTKLTNDYSNLGLIQNTLGQVLTEALQQVAGANATALANDLAGKFFPQLADDSANGGKGLPHDLAALVDETVAVGTVYQGLAAHEPASLALSQTESLFKLG